MTKSVHPCYRDFQLSRLRMQTPFEHVAVTQWALFAVMSAARKDHAHCLSIEMMRFLPISLSYREEPGWARNARGK